MTIDTAYRIIQGLLAKNQQGYATPEEFNLYINQAQQSYLDFLLGQYQKYQPGRGIAPVHFSQNQRVRTSIAPLIYGTILNVDSTGLSPYPSDFEQVDAMWSVYGFYRIRFSQQDTLWSRYNSAIDRIANNPVYLMKNEGFQFYPENIAQARLSYVRKTPTIIWAYILDFRDEPVYDPLNSIDPVWSDTDMYNIIVRVLQSFGVSMQLGVVVDYSQNIKTAGQ